MTNEAAQESTYTMGYSDDFQQLLDRRSVHTHAAHLLPHLKPGMRVLDFGCGPGTISVGLAEAVNPGELHGIDMEATQIDLARAAARAGGHANVTFRVGDVTDLPFDDDSFDVAHCHAVLMHVPDTPAVLAEVKRVLKPGGIIASRESIISSSFLYPGDEETNRAWATFARLLAGNGGHPDMGLELKARLREAGFADIRASGSFDFFGTPGTWRFFTASSTTGSTRRRSRRPSCSSVWRPSRSSMAGRLESMNGRQSRRGGRHRLWRGRGVQALDVGACRRAHQHIGSETCDFGV